MFKFVHTIKFYLVSGLILVVTCACVSSSATTEHSHSSNLPEQCQLEPLAGRCKARIARYYFDKKSSTCQTFYWGGCGGVVPFTTLDECKEACEMAKSQ